MFRTRPRPAALLCVLLAAAASVRAQDRFRAVPAGPMADCSVLVGAPTDRAAVISVLSIRPAETIIEFGSSPDRLQRSSAVESLEPGIARHVTISGLAPDAETFYRVSIRDSAGAPWRAMDTQRFRTNRAPGSTFTFCVQGDSHPERLGRMFDPDLYIRALTNVALDRPDFHFLMGDDFSIERIIERGPPQGDRTRDAVNGVYANQRSFLAIVGRSTPLMLVNGNHEQAARYLLDGTPDNFAVFAGRARTDYFPLPEPDGFYTGNGTPVEHVGLLRDYYAWEWGDALFVVIDPYWHSPVAVDNEAGARGPAREGDGAPAERQRRRDRQADALDEVGAPQPPALPPAQTEPRAGGGRGQRDLWQITLGDEQYRWLTATLTRSRARFKFVFSHHVSGTGRGGVEVAPYYEWGGQDRRASGRNRQGGATPAPAEPPPARGLARFFQARPTWEKPIHDLMRDTGVTIFFQGHDHLYARQELDGVTYQFCPNPADPTFTAFNREAYRSGDIFPNSGHLRVTVRGSADPTCTVEYVRAARPGDEAQHGRNGTIVHAYTLRPRQAATPAPATRQEPPR